MATSRFTEGGNVRDPKSPESSFSAFTTSTACASEHDSEKGQSKEAEKQDAIEAEKQDKLEIEGTHLYILIGAILLGAYSMAINGTILGTALPSITAEFHTVDDIGWYATAYLISK